MRDVMNDLMYDVTGLIENGMTYMKNGITAVFLRFSKEEEGNSARREGGGEEWVVVETNKPKVNTQITLVKKKKKT